MHVQITHWEIMEADAKDYDEVSEPQIDEGVEFVRELNLSKGDKVLDMGCGTGHVTKHIADIVGPNGHVVGVDPDTERIKIAKEKYKEVSNLQFSVGDSTIGFPHDNESYYDIHVSSNVFHWVPSDQKIAYIQKAHQCLKRGGKLAILCNAKVADEIMHAIAGFGMHSLNREGYQELFRNSGLFNNIVVDEPAYQFRFQSIVEFKRWFKASTHFDLDNLDQKHVMKYVALEDDGQVVFTGSNIIITACTI